MRGVDLYQRYNTVTDWRALARSARFAYIKGTDGFGRAVTRADHYVAQCHRHGIPVGLYHYAQFGSPERQADILIGEVNRLGAKGLVPMLDLESPFVPNATARNFGERFCRRVRQHGWRAGVYMNNSFALALNPGAWADVVWVARYYDIRPSYNNREIDMWQRSDRGRIAGVAGNVDLNDAWTGAIFTRGGATPASPKPKPNNLLLLTQDG